MAVSGATGNVMLRLRRVGAVQVILLILGVLLSGCGDDSATTEAGPSGASATSTPAMGGPRESAAGPDYALIDPAVEYDVLEAGRYALAPIGPNAGPLAKLKRASAVRPIRADAGA